ncbi:hypothetical protein IMSHALPRED_000147 [Imshaugia aleurites]|uniref:Uncharacterized protein n=1 Tax=Imshaugia aleurites TaxID=172621 RepID=A0A8H3I4T7_9LECA|nr:hypothetical protein IMSHALPRED_000147 [Imshaugia aleurites]
MPMLQHRRRQPLHERLPAAPTLLLIPLHIMNQWIKAVDLNAPGKFTVYKYHGDTRTSRYVPIANERGLERLTKSHALFNGNEQNAQTLVFSNLHTWNERHGPADEDKKMNGDRQPLGVSYLQFRMVLRANEWIVRAKGRTTPRLRELRFGYSSSPCCGTRYCCLDGFKQHSAPTRVVVCFAMIVAVSRDRRAITGRPIPNHETETRAKLLSEC